MFDQSRNLSITLPLLLLPVIKQRHCQSTTKLKFAGKTRNFVLICLTFTMFDKARPKPWVRYRISGALVCQQFVKS